MISLPHSCRCSELKVFPDTWLEKDAPMDVDWYIFYRFYLPKAKGKLIIIKGMNHCTRLADRRNVTRGLLSDEKQQLAEGYNPIAKKQAAENELEISPTSPFIEALDKAYTLLEEKPSKNEIRKALPHIKKAIQQTGYKEVEIGKVRQHHLEVVLIQVGMNKKTGYQNQAKQVVLSKKRRPSRIPSKRRAVPTEWGAQGFNHYRSYLLMLFKQIRKVGGTEVKPVDDIEKKKGVKPKREDIADDRLQDILSHIREKYYTFYRFVRIFYRGGARITELMNVKMKDVRLEESRFWVLVKKGRGEHEWKPKTITKDVTLLWEELLGECTTEQDYLFSHDLRPGSAAISPRQISERWRWHVKEQLKIEDDIRWLRHKNSTKVIDMALARIDAATAVAAGVNGHTSLAMAKKVYDLKSADRLHEEILRLESNG